ETDALLASRLATYGPRVENMERVAALWSNLLGPGREIKDWEVPLLMSAYKMFRTFQTPDYSDNSDDIDGWRKMFVEVMDANYCGSVQERTVEEYEAKKGISAPSLPFDADTWDQVARFLSDKGHLEALNALGIEFRG